MPKIIKKRTVRAEMKEEDVMDTLTRLSEQAGERKKQIAIVAVAVLVVILIATGLHLFKKNTAQRAGMLEAEAYSLIMNNKDYASMTDSERLEKALEGFKAANSTSGTAFRQYFIAVTLYELGRYEEAIAELDALMTGYSGNKVFIPTAKMKKAMTYKKMGNMDKALATLQEISLLGGSTLKDVAIIETAEILESQDKREEAKDYYSLLLREHPNSRFAPLASSRVTPPKSDISPTISPLGSGAAPSGQDSKKEPIQINLQ